MPWSMWSVLHLRHDGMNGAIEHRRGFDASDASCAQFQGKSVGGEIAHLDSLAVDEYQVSGDVAFPKTVLMQSYSCNFLTGLVKKAAKPAFFRRDASPR